MVKKLFTYTGWGVSASSLVFLLVALSAPGAGKIFSLTFLGWILIFLPPIWLKTLKYGLTVNIISRALAFVVFPLIFMTIALANGYQPSEVAKEKTKAGPTVLIASPKLVKTDIKPTPSDIPVPSTKPAIKAPAVLPSSIVVSSPSKTSLIAVSPPSVKRATVDPEKEMADFYNSLPGKMSINGKVITLYCYEPSALYFRYEDTMYAVNGTALGMGNPNPSLQYKERADDIGIVDRSEISFKARLLCDRRG